MDPQKFLYQIDDIFTPEECKRLIEKAEKIGWHTMDRGIALYDRALMTDQNLADYIFQKIKHLVPDYFMGQRVVGLNDHFRFSKYYPGGRFEIHKDGINIDKRGNRAVMTLNIFLNVPEEGGGTIFYEDPKTPSRVPRDTLKQISRVMLNARPKEGRGALFYNQILHEGETVKKGVKYLIRTDVMVAEPGIIQPKKPICYVETYNVINYD